MPLICNINMDTSNLNAIAAYLNKHKRLLAIIPGFEKPAKAFGVIVAEAAAIKQVVRIINLGANAGGNSMTSCLCSLAASVANITALYASKSKNSALLKTVTASASGLRLAKGRKITQLCLSIHDNAKKHIIHLYSYGVEGAALDMLKTIACIYDTVVLPPKLRVGLTDAHERRIIELLNNANQLLVHEIDVHVEMMAAHHAMFSKGYFKIRKENQPET